MLIQGPHHGQWALVKWFGVEEKIWHLLPSDSVFLLSTTPQIQAEIEKRQEKFRSLTRSRCPLGMAFVEGPMRDPADTLRRQNAACLDGRGWKPGLLCQHFDESLLAPDSAHHRELSFCIDILEFPNIPGEYPATLVSYQGAQTLCRAQGKHLCREHEWTFACEGPSALPYPHGYHRYLDPGASFPDRIPVDGECNFDQLKLSAVNGTRLLSNPYSLEAMLELDKTWRGTVAGQREECVSPFGVMDLTGNIEEWVESDGHLSTLKGGYWAPVQARCQMAERAHGPKHRYYQTGFRCCAKAQSLTH